MPRAKRSANSFPFFKGHGLGNDYVVLEQDPRLRLTPARIRAVCDRNRGIGSGLATVEGTG